MDRLYDGTSATACVYVASRTKLQLLRCLMKHVHLLDNTRVGLHMCASTPSTAALPLILDACAWNDSLAAPCSSDRNAVFSADKPIRYVTVRGPAVPKTSSFMSRAHPGKMHANRTPMLASICICSVLIFSWFYFPAPTTQVQSQQHAQIHDHAADPSQAVMSPARPPTTNTDLIMYSYHETDEAKYPTSPFPTPNAPRLTQLPDRI